MYSIMSSTIFSLFLAFYTLRKILDTYRQPAVLAVSKALHEPDQALPGPVSTGQGATLMGGSEISLNKGLRLLNVLAEGIHVLILFAILLLLGKMLLTAMPLYWGMMRGVALNE
jgi:hypothetical protein